MLKSITDSCPLYANHSIRICVATIPSTPSFSLPFYSSFVSKIFFDTLSFIFMFNFSFFRFFLIIMIVLLSTNNLPKYWTVVCSLFIRTHLMFCHSRSCLLSSFFQSFSKTEPYTSVHLHNTRHVSGRKNNTDKKEEKNG